MGGSIFEGSRFRISVFTPFSWPWMFACWAVSLANFCCSARSGGFGCWPAAMSFSFAAASAALSAMSRSIALLMLESSRPSVLACASSGAFRVVIVWFAWSSLILM